MNYTRKRPLKLCVAHISPQLYTHTHTYIEPSICNIYLLDHLRNDLITNYHVDTPFTGTSAMERHQPAVERWQAARGGGSRRVIHCNTCTSSSFLLSQFGPLFKRKIASRQWDRHSVSQLLVLQVSVSQSVNHDECASNQSASSVSPDCYTSQLTAPLHQL